MKFTDFNLHPSVLAGVESLGFTECTDIQSVAIPLLLEGKDVAGLSQTGTGKTAAYLLPLMDRILRSQETLSTTQTTTGETRPLDSDSDSHKSDNDEPESTQGFETEKKPSRFFENWRSGNFCLVLVPTRELAEQVRENIQQLGTLAGMTSVAVYGGMSYEPQKKALNRGVNFVIATPGRLIDLYKEHVVDLNQVRAIIFDEADRMFDMGFKEDMKYILKRIPKDRQFVVFSATLNFDVMNVAYEFGSNPIELNVSKDQAKAENVTDEVFHVGDNDKAKYLISLLKKHKPKQAIVFSNFKHQVERIAVFLSQNGIPAMGISSLLTQGQRNRVMEQFKDEAQSLNNILIATDVAARGLDVKGVDLVINYELPDDPENYVHRIGRTGRAGAKGLAYSLASDRDVEALSRIENYLGHKVTIGWLDDADIVQEIRELNKDRFQKRNEGRHGSRDSQSHKGDRRHDNRSEHRKTSRSESKPSSQSENGRENTRENTKENNREKRSSRDHKSDFKNREERSFRKPQAENLSRERSYDESSSGDKSTFDKKSSHKPNSKPDRSHRDRLTGRHKPRGEKDSDSFEKKSKEEKSSSFTGVRKTYKHRPGSDRVPSSLVRSSKKREETVGAKVAGFFKKLFK